MSERNTIYNRRLNSVSKKIFSIIRYLKEGITILISEFMETDSRQFLLLVLVIVWIWILNPNDIRTDHSRILSAILGVFIMSVGFNQNVRYRKTTKISIVYMLGGFLLLLYGLGVINVF